MDERAALDARLDALARMLPPWLARLRDPAQFWPQFRALAREIVLAAPPGLRAYARRRLAVLLEAHAHELPVPVPHRFLAARPGGGPPRRAGRSPR